MHRASMYTEQRMMWPHTPAHAGVLFPRATKDSGGAAPTPGRPTVLREDGESSLTLRDTWARVYLARGCAAAIQSGHIAGDLHGAGAVFWEALQLLAIADPSDLVRGCLCWGGLRGWLVNAVLSGFVSGGCLR